jgi:hypothetical protein
MASTTSPEYNVAIGLPPAVTAELAVQHDKERIQGMSFAHENLARRRVSCLGTSS